MGKVLEFLNTFTIGQLPLATLLGALLVFIVLVIVKRIVLRLYRKIADKTKIDPSVKSFIDASINTIMWLLIVLITVDRLGIPVTSLVAFVSVVGVALSLSLQGILENIFSGMTLLVTKPIEVGEYVQLGDTSGTVRKLTLFYTVLVMPDGKTAYIPNSTMTRDMLINHSDERIRRVEFTIAASYDDEPDRVLEALKKAAKETESVTAEREPVAFVSKYANSSIEYTLYAFTENARFLETKYAVMRQVFYTFRNMGVTMTYDHLNLHIVEDDTTGGEEEC